LIYLPCLGVGREIGITSGPTKAIKAAILGRKYAIPFTGKTSFLFIEDTADIFVASSLAQYEGALVLNMRGEILSSEEFLELLYKQIPQAKGLVTIKSEAAQLPLAYDFHQKGLDKLLPGYKYTSIAEGISKTTQHFLDLQKRGLLKDNDLLD